MLGRDEFERALRENETVLRATNVAISERAETQAALITGNPKVPDFDPDREVIWTVEGSSVRFNLSALLAKPKVASTTELNSTNAIVHSMGDTLCMLARSTHSPSQFLFSAEAKGTYEVAITVSSIDLEPWARRSNPTEQIPAAKLAAAQWLTQSQVDARIEALDHPVDLAAKKEFTLAAISGGGLGAANLALPVTASRVRYTIGQVVRDASRIVITVTPIASVAKLRPYHVQIGTTRLAFAAARVNPGDAHNPDIYEWIGAYPSWGTAGDKVTLYIYEPIGRENFVPGGDPADNGRVLKRAATGPEWGTLAYSDLTERPAQPALIMLNDASNAELRVNNSSNTVGSGPTLTTFSTTPLDLDEYRHGELRVALTLAVGQLSAVGFGTRNDKIHNVTQIVFLSDLRAAANWVAGGTVEGLKIGDGVDVYRSNVKLGVVQFYLGRNANGTTGYYWEYKGEAGSSNFNISARLTVSLSPTDASAAGGKVATIALAPSADRAQAQNVIFQERFTVVAGSGYRDVQAGVLGCPRFAVNGPLGWYVVARKSSAADAAVLGRVVLLAAAAGTHIPWGPAHFLRCTDDGTERSVSVHYHCAPRATGPGLRGGNSVEVWGRGNTIKQGTVVDVYEWR